MTSAIRGITVDDAIRERPDHLTNNQLMKQIVPDIEQRLQALKQRNFELYKVLHDQAMTTRGFRPFDEGTTDWQIMMLLVPEIRDVLSNLKQERPAYHLVLRQRIESEDGFRPFHYWQGFD